MNSLDHYLRAWNLSDPQPLATTATSHVYTVTFEGVRAVLKLITEYGFEERQGAIALRYFDGHRAVRLLREDEQAHLLEYADGQDLVDFVRNGADDEATSIIADVINQLHQQNNKPLPSELTPLKVWFKSLFDRADSDQNKGITSIYTRSATLAEKLFDQARDIRVLHGDIHHENIRYKAGRGWLAFDPKGLVGERTYDAANTLCNPINMPELVTREERLLRTSRILAEKMGIEHSRVLAFVYIYACLSASWSESDGNDAGHALRVAELAERNFDHSSF